MLNAEGQYVLFVCEGVAEQYILTTLIERGELTVPNELIVPNQLRGTWYFTSFRAGMPGISMPGGTAPSFRSKSSFIIRA